MAQPADIVQRVAQLAELFVDKGADLAPLVAGKILWFLWDDPFKNGWGIALRMISFAAVTWGLTLASWRWIESPLQSVRARMAEPR